MNKKLLEKLEALEQRTTAEPIEIYILIVDSKGETIEREHWGTITATGTTINQGE